MRNKSVRVDFLVGMISDALKEYSVIESEGIFEPILREISKDFPSCSEEEILEILQLCISIASNKPEEKTELVITTLDSFKLRSRKIRDVIQELLNSAEESIVFTGYSVSDYFAEMIDTIIRKSQQGIYVTLYVNNAEKQSLERLLAYQGKFLKVYEYSKSKVDKMAALHAKILVVDKKKSLVSSANLSYHGLEGNIEIGLLNESLVKAMQIEDLFKEMIRMKVFKRIN